MPAPGDATPIPAAASGYVQEIDTERLLRGPVEHDATIWLSARPGDFVVRGEAIGCLRTGGPVDVIVERVTSAVVIGPDRTAQQDAAFGIQQLVEVVLRALSPGMNEPFTAIAAIDRMGQVLLMMAGRRIPGPTRVDDSGRLRVVAVPRTFAELAEDGFGPIADYGGGHAAVLSHVFATLERVSRRTRWPDDAAALRHLADRLWPQPNAPSTITSGGSC